MHVIATINTADRSIAVVDFALRRRFAWYTIKPECFSTGVIPESKELFEEISAIFEKYASDSELNLQPGGAYFMASTIEELNQKIEYELMPLIKEYLEEGTWFLQQENLAIYSTEKSGKTYLSNVYY